MFYYEIITFTDNNYSSEDYRAVFNEMKKDFYSPVAKVQSRFQLVVISQEDKLMWNFFILN